MSSDGYKTTMETDHCGGHNTLASRCQESFYQILQLLAHSYAVSVFASAEIYQQEHASDASLF